jgi:ammonium transporter, Amt family
MNELQTSLESANAVNLEFFYWVSIALMFAIHAGFLVYESGASRVKNVLASAMKNLMTLAVVIPTFFFFGWFLYNAMVTGVPRINPLAEAALPWSANMGPNLSDSLSGVFWGCFALFSATTASIVSGAVIERIRLSAFLILAAVIGSVVWVIGASWGWHPAGWMLTELGFHDAGAAGCVHLIAGAFTLGVLINLGPRIGRFLADGTAVTIRGHNLWMSMLGLMLIYIGFFGFMMGCVIYSGDGFVNIYGAPTNLSAWVFNMLMGLAGGLIGAYIASRGEPFWCVSGGLGGVIAVAAGIDVYHPALAFVIAVAGALLMVFAAGVVERLKIDDAVGAVAVHGVVGFWSLIAMGIFASGYPNVVGPDVSIGGQALGAVVFLALGFVPGWVVSKALAVAGLLRVPPAVEIAGLDLSEIPATAYPEGVPPTPEPRIALAASANGQPAVAEPATS